MDICACVWESLSEIALRTPTSRLKNSEYFSSALALEEGKIIKQMRENQKQALCIPARRTPIRIPYPDWIRCKKAALIGAWFMRNASKLRMRDVCPDARASSLAASSCGGIPLRSRSNSISFRCLSMVESMLSKRTSRRHLECHVKIFKTVS